MIGEGLSPAARALLDAARPAMGPDAAAIGRMRAKVGSAAAKSAATALAVKLGLVAVVATLAAGAALYGNRERAATTPQLELPQAQAEAIAPVVRNRITTPPAVIEMAPERMNHEHKVAVALPATPVSAPAAVEIRADLAREVELVDHAMAALRRGDTASALDAIRTHARETHGTGQLTEDAAAIEIEALCRRHDPIVITRLEAFDARFPRSAQRSRLSATCP
jgi:hypothetical protein